ncbi:MAG: NUDIX domain-containing protein [Actinobacteria bacterium]|nr:NUDIX domain-containing protein [Actinomycetota bacterium]
MKIRAVALAAIRRGDEVLVFGCYDSTKRAPFERLFGGGIDGGEHAIDAVAREIREELGAEIDDVRLLGVLENIFTYEGKPEHEIAFVFDARFADPSREARDSIVGVEGNGEELVGRWRARGDVEPPLYPTGTAELVFNPPV